MADFKFSIVSDTFRYTGYNLLEDPYHILEAVKVAGYAGVDLPGKLSAAEAIELKRIVNSFDLKVPAIQGAWAFFHAGENRDLAGADEEARQAGIRYAKRGIDLAAELGAPFFSVCAPQPPIAEIPFPKLPIESLRRNFRESMLEVCAHAEDRKITVLFEPLNMYEAYPGVLSSVFDAIRVVDEIGSSNLGVQPDIYHMYHAESSVPDALRLAGKRIRHMHVNETNRHSVGTGQADYKAIFRVLKDLRYDGYLSIYMPSTTQAVYQLASQGYGAAGTSSRDSGATRPDLKPYLEWSLYYLRAIEGAVDRQRALAGLAGDVVTG